MENLDRNLISWPFPSKSIRKKNNIIQTPIISYSRPADRRKIALMGTIHIAEKEYFSILQNIIGHFENKCGFKILYEGLRPDEDPSNNEEEKKIWSQMERFFNMLNFASERSGLAYQMNGLEYQNNKENWVNSDMQAGELIRLLAADGITSKEIDKFFPAFERAGSFLNNIRLSELFPYIMDFCLRNMGLLALLSYFLPNRSPILKHIIESRNRVALQKIKEYLQLGDNILAIWGASHLRGLEKGIKKMGFRKLDTLWVDAYHIRGLKMPKGAKK